MRDELSEATGCRRRERARTAASPWTLPTVSAIGVDVVGLAVRVVELPFSIGDGQS